MRIAVVVPTAGPYWQARGRALAAYPNIEALLLAVCDREHTYRWETDTSDWMTLRTGLYEELNWRDAADAAIARLSDFGPDAVLTMGYSDPLMRRIARWAKGHGIVSLSAWSGGPGDRKRSWWVRTAKRWLLRWLYDGAFASGERSRAYALELGFPPEKVLTGYDVVDNAAFAREVTAISAGGDTQQAPFFLYVGRFAPEKNLQRLLEAYRQYYATKPPSLWELTLVGDGGERESLRATVARAGLAGVHFHPWANRDELVTWYGRASCLILPSLSEPWGLVVNEAMAAGLSVLVSDRCGCAPELVDEGQNGFTFDPLDVQQLAGLMRRMADTEPPVREAMGRRSQEIISQYTPETWAERLVELAIAAGAPRN